MSENKQENELSQMSYNSSKEISKIFSNNNTLNKGFYLSDEGDIEESIIELKSQILKDLSSKKISPKHNKINDRKSIRSNNISK